MTFWARIFRPRPYAAPVRPPAQSLAPDGRIVVEGNNVHIGRGMHRLEDIEEAAERIRAAHKPPLFTADEVIAMADEQTAAEALRARIRQDDEEAATKRREDAIGRFWAQREAVRGGRALRGPDGRFLPAGRGIEGNAG